MFRKIRELWVAFFTAVMIAGMYIPSGMYERVLELDRNAQCPMCYLEQRYAASLFTSSVGSESDAFGFEIDSNASHFKWEGSHVTVSCTKCHVDSVFGETMMACLTCHLTVEEQHSQIPPFDVLQK